MVALFGRQNRSEAKNGGLAGWRRLRRILGRTLLVALLGILGLFTVATVAFLFAPTRGVLLGWGVRLADDALPGRLTVEAVDWTSFGHLVLEDVLWVAGSAAVPGDTLADLAAVDLILDLAALKDKDARIESVRLEVRTLDIPAIVVAISDMSPEASDDSTGQASAPAEIP